MSEGKTIEGLGNYFANFITWLWGINIKVKVKNEVRCTGNEVIDHDYWYEVVWQ